jgi:hypothetical protein
MVIVPPEATTKPGAVEMSGRTDEIWGDGLQRIVLV